MPRPTLYIKRQQKVCHKILFSLAIVFLIIVVCFGSLYRVFGQQSTAAKHIIVGTKPHKLPKTQHTHTRKQYNWQQQLRRRLYLKSSQKILAQLAFVCWTFAVFTADARWKLLRLPLKCCRVEVSRFSKQLVAGKAHAKWTTKPKDWVNRATHKKATFTSNSKYISVHEHVCVYMRKVCKQLGLGMKSRH